ncbi:hypothetical protein N7456_008133 [Penicillium angulare]|uniref:Xylanolytic transcriptional activator regulatory domain-containing protein n=1 Tax=Penicillium angulare TaxID=116970 RepID=A0A9W9K9X7_9EURO|nr:hypothetical protein N7456_008133 [Penicillium angulare]
MPEVEKLLAQILYKAIDHIKTIHALLLLCLWPIPQPQYLQNPAWNYIGLAINAAMQLHCHTLSEPDTEEGEWRGFAPTTDSKVTNETKSRTWLGCVKVGTLVALVLGMPMPISTQQHMRSIDRSIETLSKSNETPDSTSPLSSTVSILKIQISAMETLADVEDLNVHSKISQLFLNQLDQIHYEDSDAPHSHLLPNLDLSQAIAKLYVISMSFNLLTRDSTEDPIFQANHLKTLQESYRSATHIIHLFKNTNIEKVEDSAGYLDYQPELYLTPLLHATTILFRYLATFPSPSGEDYIHAIESMKDAHLIFQSFPKRREFIRAAIHIESLMDILKKGIPSRSMDRLVVRNKLGASVMFDAIFHACRQRNLDPRTGEPRAVREWKTVNDTFAERLPKIPIAREKDSALLSSSMDNEATVTAPYTQNPEWWEEWDKYIDLFQVGDEQMDIAF